MSEEKTIIKQLNQDEIRDFILKKDYELYKYKEVLDKIKDIIKEKYSNEDGEIWHDGFKEIYGLLEEIE